MRKNYLLPNCFKRIGMIMFLPFFALCIWLLAGPCEGDWFRINVPALFTLDLASTSEWFAITVTDPVNEICMTGLLVSLVFMAISLLRLKAGKTQPLYCLSEESALAVSGELYGKKAKQAQETDQETENTEENIVPSEEKEEL